MSPRWGLEGGASPGYKHVAPLGLRRHIEVLGSRFLFDPTCGLGTRKDGSVPRVYDLDMSIQAERV